MNTLLNPTALGDLLFTYQVGSAANANLLVGIQYIDSGANAGYYATGRSSTDNIKKLYKFNLSGNFLSSTVQDACASSTFGWRDLDYDGTNLITADECGVDIVNPTTGGRVGGYALPGGALARSMARNPADNSCYTANFNSTIYRFNCSTGAVLNTYAANGLLNYGFGWDNVSAGGPYLWSWAQQLPGGGTCPNPIGSNNCIRAVRLTTTGAQTGVAFNGVPFYGSGGESSGGADIGTVGGILTLIGLHQASPNFPVVRGYDLAAGPTSTPTNTPLVSNTPTNTFTPSNTSSPTNTPCPFGNYAITSGGGAIVPGTTDSGSHGDDTLTAVALPFPYTLYDTTYTTAQIGSNGALFFGTAFASFNITCIPNTLATYVIAPYWADQCTGACGASTCTGCGVFTSISGSSPNRILNIEYRTNYYSTNVALDYEIRLYEGQTHFEVVYGTVNALSTANDSSLSVGVQKTNTTYALWGCDTTGGQFPPVSTGQQLNFDFFCVAPTATNTPLVSDTPTNTRTPTNTPIPTNTLTPSPTPCTIITGSLTAGDPQQSDRLFRDGILATCSAPKACPGPISPAPRAYDAYTFVNNTGGAACIIVTLDPLSCDGTGTNAIQSAAYLGSYDPTNVCTTNYLADIGNSPTVATSYSFNVPAGATFVVVVNEINSGAGCPQYTLAVAGLICATPTPTNTPCSPSCTPTSTSTSTFTNTPTITLTPTNTFTPTMTFTPTATATCPPVFINIGGDKPGKLVPPHMPKGSKNNFTSLLPRSSNNSRVAKPSSPVAPLTLQLDDGGIENSIGYGSSGTTENAALWLNRFTPPSGAYPISLAQIHIFWPDATFASGDLTGKMPKLLVYLDADGDGNPANATLLYQNIVSIATTNAFQTYNITPNLNIAGPGDVYIGFEDFWAENGNTPRLYPAAIDQTASQVRSWVLAMNSFAPPNINNLGNNDLSGTIDSFGLPGNWMIRASGQSSLPPLCPPTNTPTPTNTPIPTNTPTPTDTPTPTNTPIPTDTPTITPTNTPAVINLVGHVTWAGQSQPNALQQRFITLTLCSTSGGPTSTYTSTTDASGFFTANVASLVPGTYNWRDKGRNSLANGGTLTLTGSNQQLEMGVQKGGDADGSNVVSSQDFTILKNTFQSTTDPRADFNNDGVVNGQDFTILKNNFSLAGAPATCP